MSRRVLLYSHDSYGLGHLSRSVTLARSVVERSDGDDVLLVTGTPRPQAFPLPFGVDMVKMPAITKSDDGGYKSRSLRMGLDRIAHLRSRLIDAAVASFAPDVILVDHVPSGLEGELLPMLDSLRLGAVRPEVILGLRDIIDEPSRVRAEWDATGVWKTIDSEYDRVFVYGDEAVGTTALELELDRKVRCPVEHVGYVAREVPGRSARPTEQPVVLVTVGGGGDGHRLLRAYGRFLEELGPSARFRSVVVAGPLLSPRRRAEIDAMLYGSGAPVEVLTFSSDHVSLIANADAIIAMAGYNTTCEILRSGVPALLVPREAPRLEQSIRASRLAALGAVETCSIEQLTATDLDRFVTGAIGGTVKNLWPMIRLDGARTVADRIGSPLEGSDG